MALCGQGVRKGYPVENNGIQFQSAMQYVSSMKVPKGEKDYSII